MKAMNQNLMWVLVIAVIGGVIVWYVTP